MFERYSEKARRVIFFGRYEASQFGSNYIEPEHLLLGLLREDPSAFTAIDRTNNPVAIQERLVAQLPKAAHVSTTVDLPLSQSGKQVLHDGAEEAQRMNSLGIDTHHLLLGVLGQADTLAVKTLAEFGIELDKAREALRGHIPKTRLVAVAGDPQERCVLEFLDEKGTKVGITALKIVNHLPRVGDHIMIESEHSGTRSYVVREVTHVYTEIAPEAPVAPHAPKKIVVRLETVAEPGQKFGDLT